MLINRSKSFRLRADSFAPMRTDFQGCALTLAVGKALGMPAKSLKRWCRAQIDSAQREIIFRAH